MVALFMQCVFNRRKWSCVIKICGKHPSHNVAPALLLFLKMEWWVLCLLIGREVLNDL